MMAQAALLGCPYSTVAQSVYDSLHPASLGFGRRKSVLPRVASATHICYRLLLAHIPTLLASFPLKCWGRLEVRLRCRHRKATQVRTTDGQCQRDYS